MVSCVRQQLQMTVRADQVSDSDSDIRACHLNWTHTQQTNPLSSCILIRNMIITGTVSLVALPNLFTLTRERVSATRMMIIINMKFYH